MSWCSQLREDRNAELAVVFYFFLFSLIIYWEHLQGVRFTSLFWFCSHTPLLFAFAFFVGRKALVKAIINVGFIPQFLWSLDFLSRLLTGHYVFRVTTYLFDHPLGVYTLIPIVGHMLTTNLAFFMTRKEKPTLKVLGLSAVYVAVLIIVSYFFTDSVRNVNCVRELCGFPGLTWSWYPFTLFFLVMGVLVLPTFWIQWWVWKRSVGKFARRST